MLAVFIGPLLLCVTLTIVSTTLPSPASPLGQISEEPEKDAALTMEHRHILRELLLKNSPIAPARAEAIEEGEAVPIGIELHAIPRDVTQRIPQTKAHSYILVGTTLLIVHTASRRVLDVIR